MDEDSTSSSSESDYESQKSRQVWQLKKLWAKELASMMGNPKVTREHFVRTVVALSGTDENILNELKTPSVCFRPNKAKATMDGNRRRVIITGQLFQPGMVKSEGESWKLVAENSLYSCLIPMMFSSFEEELPNQQLYIVLNGDIDVPSRHIRLDQDYRKTVVISVNSGSLSKTERAVHSVLSWNFDLNWSSFAKYQLLTVKPLNSGVTTQPKSRSKAPKRTSANKSSKNYPGKPAQVGKLQTSNGDSADADTTQKMNRSKLKNPRKMRSKVKAKNVKSANPMIERWLIKRRKMVRKRSKWYFAYSNALKSLREHPVQLTCGKELKNLKYFGDAMCRKIDQKFDCRNCPSCENG